LGDSEWSCWGSELARILKNKLLVFRVAWGGAETCPFQSVHDTRYHGYEYGSHDWVFIKKDTMEIMHIGDLLFHQITRHHFFQSSSSSYRVDVKKMIEFFNLRSGVDYTSDLIVQDIWRNTGSHSTSRNLKKPPTECCTIKKCELKELRSDEFKHLDFGINHVYHDNKCALVYINDMTTMPKILSSMELILILMMTTETMTISEQKRFVSNNLNTSPKQKKKRTGSKIDFEKN